MSYTTYQVVNLFLILKAIHLNIKGIFFYVWCTYGGVVKVTPGIDGLVDGMSWGGVIKKSWALFSFNTSLTCYNLI